MRGLFASLLLLLLSQGVRVALAEPIGCDAPGRRWRGININSLAVSNGVKSVVYDEADFALLKEWGFNFTRLTLDYRLWIKNGDWNQIDDEALAEVDRGIALGRKYGLHVMLNFHRAPGHCVCVPYEPVSAFADAEARAVCARHWAHFARRYKGIPNCELSFNLFNEPPSWCLDEHYTPTVEAVIEAVRAEDPARLIIVDGLNLATEPPTGLIGRLRQGVSFHGYSDNPDALFAVWDPVIAAGNFVMAGELGCGSDVPHAQAMMRLLNYLKGLKARNVGWALWEIRGGFGVLNSGRSDTVYESFRGEWLDREMLALLRSDGDAVTRARLPAHCRNRYWKFIFPQCAPQFGELGLFDGEGNRVNLAENVVRLEHNGGASFANLFDGDLRTPCYEPDKDDYWVAFELKSVPSVGIASAALARDASYPSVTYKTPASWRIYTRAHETDVWLPADERMMTSRNEVDGWGVYSGAPFAFPDRILSPVSVVEGTVLDLTESSSELGCIAVDCAGAGTLLGGKLAAVGTLRVDGATSELASVRLPLNLVCTTVPSDLSGWNVVVNGQMREGWSFRVAGGGIWIEKPGLSLMLH